MAFQNLQRLGLAMRASTLPDPGAANSVNAQQDTAFTLLVIPAGAASGTRTIRNGSFIGQTMLLVNSSSNTATIQDVNNSLSLSMASNSAALIVYVSAGRWRSV